MLEVFMKAVITAAAGTLVGTCVVWIKWLIRREKVFDDALKALAHDSFYRQCRYLLPHETISEDELENLNYLHDAYTSLGLNGTGEELYKRCLQKSIR